MADESRNPSDQRCLILMRHAKSDWGDQTLSDHDRPLNARGQKDTPRMANWLAGQGTIPDLILSSSSQRTRDTAQLLCDAWSETPEVIFTESLYLSSPETILNTICSEGGNARCLMILAHNPGMSHLASVLAQEPIDMPTAAIAIFQVSVDRWRDIGSSTKYELIDFMRPKALPKS